jgi:precorrin isomerase
MDLNKHIIGDFTMVSKAIQNLDENDLRFIEELLSKQLSHQIEQDKTWQSKNGYDRPHARVNRILTCLNAIKSQRQMVRVHSVKW